MPWPACRVYVLSLTPLTWMKYRVLSSSMAFSHLSVSASIVTVLYSQLSLYLSFCLFQERCFPCGTAHTSLPKSLPAHILLQWSRCLFSFLKYGNYCSFVLLVVSFGHNIFSLSELWFVSDAILRFAGSGLVMESVLVRPLLGKLCCAYWITDLKGSSSFVLRHIPAAIKYIPYQCRILSPVDLSLVYIGLC